MKKFFVLMIGFGIILSSMSYGMVMAVSATVYSDVDSSHCSLCDTDPGSKQKVSEKECEVYADIFCTDDDQKKEEMSFRLSSHENCDCQIRSHHGEKQVALLMPGMNFNPKGLIVSSGLYIAVNKNITSESIDRSSFGRAPPSQDLLLLRTVQQIK